MNRLVILSGCSGGGESTLVVEFSKRGYAVVEEPDRRIVLEEGNNGGSALSWQDIKAFLRRAIEVALDDRL